MGDIQSASSEHIDAPVFQPINPGTYMPQFHPPVMAQPLGSVLSNAIGQGLNIGESVAQDLQKGRNNQLQNNLQQKYQDEVLNNPQAAINNPSYAPSLMTAGPGGVQAAAAMNPIDQQKLQQQMQLQNAQAEEARAKAYGTYAGAGGPFAKITGMYPGGMTPPPMGSNAAPQAGSQPKGAGNQPYVPVQAPMQQGNNVGPFTPDQVKDWWGANYGTNAKDVTVTPPTQQNPTPMYTVHLKDGTQQLVHPGYIAANLGNYKLPLNNLQMQNGYQGNSAPDMSQPPSQDSGGSIAQQQAVPNDPNAANISPVQIANQLNASKNPKDKFTFSPDDVHIDPVKGVVNISDHNGGYFTNPLSQYTGSQPQQPSSPYPSDNPSQIPPTQPSNGPAPRAQLISVPAQYAGHPIYNQPGDDSGHNAVPNPQVLSSQPSLSNNPYYAVKEVQNDMSNNGDIPKSFADATGIKSPQQMNSVLGQRASSDTDTKSQIPQNGQAPGVAQDPEYNAPSGAKFRVDQSSGVPYVVLGQTATTENRLYQGQNDVKTFNKPMGEAITNMQKIAGEAGYNIQNMNVSQLEAANRQIYADKNTKAMPETMADKLQMLQGAMQISQQINGIINDPKNYDLITNPVTQAKNDILNKVGGINLGGKTVAQYTDQPNGPDPAYTALNSEWGQMRSMVQHANYGSRQTALEISNLLDQVGQPGTMDFKPRFQNFVKNLQDQFPRTIDLALASNYKVPQSMVDVANTIHSGGNYVGNDQGRTWTQSAPTGIPTMSSIQAVNDYMQNAPVGTRVIGPNGKVITKQSTQQAQQNKQNTQ